MRLPEPDPKTSGEKLITAAFLITFLGMIGYGLFAQAFSPRKMAAVFVPLWFIPLLAWHELGHAVAARLCGWGLRGIVIGCGGEWARVQCLGTWMSFRIWPVSGYVLPRIRDLNAAKWKNAFIYAAGPGAEALLLGIAWMIYGADLMRPSPEIPVIAAQSLAVAVLIGLLFNLIPMTVDTETGEAWNDGLGIIQSLRMSEADYAQMLRQEDWRDAAEAAKAAGLKTEEEEEQRA